MSLDDQQVRAVLAAVEEPELRRGLGELGMVRSVRTRRRKVQIDIAVPGSAWPVLDELHRRVVASICGSSGGGAISEGGGAGGSGVGTGLGVAADDVDVTFVPMSAEDRSELLVRLARPRGGEPAALPGAGAGHGHSHGASGGAPQPLGHEEGRPNRFMVPGSRTRVIGVSSGKGGVGKSSVTVNLAVALAARGLDVGLLDADVYGFSVPKMLGVTRPPTQLDTLLVPPVLHGVRCLSMGYFVEDDQPVVWRGPMLHKALEQFLVDAYWGEPDYLLIDMPPGTGDVALSLGQYLPRAEILVVTTPQPAAQRVAQRSAIAARSLKLAVRGVVENMSWFTGDDGKRYELFGAGGGQSLADDLQVPLLGQVPLVPAVRQGGDDGVPVRLSEPEGEAARAFDALADTVAAMGPARRYRKELAVR